MEKTFFYVYLQQINTKAWLMKKYIKPEILVVLVEQTVLQSASVKSIVGTDDIGYGGGAIGDARTREVFSEDEW